MKIERELDTMSGVNISGLGIRFGATKVISGLDLEVREGEFLVLLGPSGCGKSTLLHGIAGLIEVNEGRIDIGGQDMTTAEPAERGIGMVFQSYALYPNMTVERNMSFGLRVARLPRAEIARRVDRAAKMLQLEPLLKRKPAQLSGGQRQRVAIGRALVRQARVFLFDEPLSNLDAKLRAELRRELKLLHQTLGATMVYVTHDQVEAMTLATRIVVMQSGLIQQIGTPAEVYERPANLFVAGFLGSPGMNLLRTRIVASDGAGPRSEGPLSISLNRYAFAQAPEEGQEVFMGVRPEHIKVAETGRWAATVELFEPMGNHQVLWLRMDDGTAISAVVHDLHTPIVGARLSFDIEDRLVSLFDVKTERRL